MITIDGKTFELANFTKSATASRIGIDNSLQGDIRKVMFILY